MAQRRMFSLKIIDTDLFLDMPMSARLLYYDLSMRADDDGFVASPKKIQRVIGCSNDDFRLLITKQFIIPFENGICVIKHWRIHNYIRSDRYASTIYQEEKRLLVENNGTYELNDIQNVIPSDNQVVDKMDTQVRLGKDRLEIGKDSIDKEEPKPKNKPPKEIKHKYGEYNHISLTDKEYEKLVKDFNEKLIKSFITKMDEYIELHGKTYKNYNLAIRQWIKRDNDKGNSKQNKAVNHKVTTFNNYDQREYDYDELEKKLLGN
ncbi:MAG: Phage replication initiation protein [Anaerocolumna sp.]|nr:Phage replication initiation protein [Anaerocolumna sp.]